LIEALLLAGVTIMIVGHTRAVASVEHNIAHYWEMMQLRHGNPPPAHGTSVGVATLLAWPLSPDLPKRIWARSTWTPSGKGASRARSASAGC
jgi:glycerol dehydrogenase-like iron-containing ADH family enzyme